MTAGTAVAEPAAPAGWRPPVGRVVAVLVAVVLAAAPLFLAPFAINTLSRILVFALLAVSLDLLVGVTGLPSLGHAAYFGVGAYAAGIYTIEVGGAVPVPLLVGAVAGAVAAAATGWVAVRTHGVFFLMLTLAIGELLTQLAQSRGDVTGGFDGLQGVPAATVGGAALSVFGSPGLLYWYVLAVFLLGFALLWAVARSPYGAALRGIRDNEPRMRALGYPTALYKYGAFVLAGAVAGMAGSLLVVEGTRLVTPLDLGFTTSALMLLAVIIGGTGSLWGAALGAALVIVVRDTFGVQLGGHGELLLGLLFVAVVYLLPRGVAGLLPARRERP